MFFHPTLLTTQGLNPRGVLVTREEAFEKDRYINGPFCCQENASAQLTILFPHFALIVIGTDILL